ncbi:hypothetical protein EAF04_004803 [Stromatinia cepivora]|nr:hypothetical protein EAF04_004803 [Stromatinia cepivora]
MNENYFLSLCKGSVQYCSVKQQEESLEWSPKHHISLTTITYIHLFVQSGPHSAAVQITINPFSLGNYPQQTFFHSNCRYSLCCGKAPQDTIATIVKERVQKVYDTFYLPGHWDFSHDQYVTADHFDTVHNISKESCLLTTNSMLREYIQSINVVVSTSEGLASSPAAHRVRERSLVSNYGQRSNQASLTPSRRTRSYRTRSYRTRPEKDLLLANDNYDANSTQPTQSTVQHHSDNNKIQNIVEAAAVKIRKGLNNLESAYTLPQLSNDFENLYDKAKYFEEDLWAQASRTEAVFNGVKWSSRFLSCCFRMTRLNLGIEDGANSQPMTESKNKTDNRTRKDWQTATEMINSIVNCLLETWEWKAFLIYPALESTGYYFSSSAQLAKKKRQNIVSSLVKILRDEVPTVSGPAVILDPAFFVSCALNINYNTICTNLKLDAAPTVKIIAERLRWESHSSFDRLATGYKLLPEGEHYELQNERTYSAFPSRKRKAGAESESAPSQTKKSSTGAFPSGSNHGYEKIPVSNPEDHQFLQDVVPALPGPQLPIPRREPTIDTNSTTPHINISIGALLNTADYIAGSSQSQQLSTTGNSSIQIASGAVLSGHEQDSTADEQAEIGSSGWDAIGLESQAEADGPPSKQRRVDTIPSLDSSFPQPSSGITYNQHEGATESSTHDVKSNVAIMGEVCKWESYLGAHLFKYLDQKQRCGRYTNAVRLHLRLSKDDDYRLEVWLCSSIKQALSQAISQAKTGLFEDLRYILGDYLFEAAKASNWNKDQEMIGISLGTSFVDDGSNCKMEVMLSSKIGAEIHANVFPLIL